VIRHLASVAGLVAVGIAAGLAAPPSHGAEPIPATSAFAKDRADCDAGRTAEDRATCLREAGAARIERKRNTLDTNGSTRENATLRCNLVAPKDKADCLARIEGPSKPNQKTTTSGSVAGGGMLRETTTTTTGQPTLIIVPAPSASTPR
jgi:hypothetical protein